MRVEIIKINITLNEKTNAIEKKAPNIAFLDCVRIIFNKNNPKIIIQIIKFIGFLLFLIISKIKKGIIAHKMNPV